MSINPEEAQGSPAPDLNFDDQAGVYGFFRRHQKKLLYTAGIFTLLTFSITGSIDGLVSNLSRKDRDLSSIMVNGERVQLTSKDYTYGSLIARNYQRGIPRGVMLPLISGEGGDSELGEVFAIMRRAAIAEGIEASYAEVDRAIEATREFEKAESPSKLAVSHGFGSLAEYRLLVAEALRIGMYTRLQTLALDTTDAEVMRQLLLHREKAAFKVATFDEQVRQDEMKANSELADEDLKAWLDDQNEGQKGRMNAYDLPTVQLRFAALLTGEGQFNPDEWADTVLEGYALGDDQLRGFYDSYKELFKVEDTEDEYRPFEDESVRSHLTRMAQAERVAIDLNTKLKKLQLEQVQPKSDEIAKAQSAFNDAQGTQTAANKQKIVKGRELAAKQAELAKDPEDAELKAAVTALEVECAAAKEALFAADPVLAQMKSTLEEAQKAEEDARANFDFFGEFDKLVVGKSGFVHKSLDKQLNAEALKDLDGLGLDLGVWELAITATSLKNVGDIGNGVGRTTKAAVLYQVTAMEARPLKPWEELKPLVQDAYWAEKAVKEGREKTTAMTDALLRLAKEKIPEFLAETEKERQGRIDTLAAEWEAKVKAEISSAQEMLKMPGLGTQARNGYQTSLDRKEQELASKELRIARFGKQVGAEIDQEIGEEANKHYKDVLDAAAAEVGYTVSDFGPYTRELTSQPRFAEAYDPAVVYTFLNHSEMEIGEAVGPVTDSAERRSYVIVCSNVEPLTAADVTRREFERVRKVFLLMQQQNAIYQAFTAEALGARYQLEQAVGVQEEESQ